MRLLLSLPRPAYLWLGTPTPLPTHAGRHQSPHKQSLIGAVASILSSCPSARCHLCTHTQTADILQAVMGLALKKRLREYESVNTSVSCDMRGLLDGRFNSMCIEGRHWHTPLGMTAHKLEVGLLVITRVVGSAAQGRCPHVAAVVNVVRYRDGFVNHRCSTSKSLQIRSTSQCTQSSPLHSTSESGGSNHAAHTCRPVRPGLCCCVCLPASQVQIGAMQVDLGTLVWERRVAMHNVPLGAVQIHLSGKDMGNFVSHPLFQQAASTAVQVSGALHPAVTAAAGSQRRAAGGRCLLGRRSDSNT